MKVKVYGILFAIFAVAQLGYADSLYPMEVAKRPTVLPSGMWQVDGDFETGRGLVKEDDPSMSAKLKMTAKVGVTDDFQLSIGYDGLRVDQFEAKKSVRLSGNFNLFANSFMATTGTISFPVHFEEKPFKSVALTAPTAFILNQDMAILALYEGFFNLGYEKDEKKEEDPKLVAKIELPVMFGWQVSKRVWLDVGTTLFSTDFTREETKTILQKTPVRLDAIVAVNNMFDVFVSGGVKNAQDPMNTFSVNLGVKFRGDFLQG